MRIAIVGAGAVGCSLAAPLSTRHDVVLVARSGQADGIDRNGLIVQQDGSERRVPLRAATAVPPDSELMLLTVKTQDVSQATRMIAAVRSSAPVVVMQNGIQADDLAAAELGRDRVLGAVVVGASTYLKPGMISVDFEGWLVLGEPFGPVRARSRTIASVLQDARPTYITRNLHATRWSKLITNLNNGLSAATGCLLVEFLRSHAGRVLPVRTMKEGVRVAQAAGVRLDHGIYSLSPSSLRKGRRAPAAVALLQASLPWLVSRLPEEVAVRVLLLTARSKLGRLPIRGSTWQSVIRGVPTEIDYLNGAVVELGRKLGVPTPYNARIVELVHEVEKRRSFFPIEALIAGGLASESTVPTT